MVFAPSLQFGFVYDDLPVIVDNSTLGDPGALLRAFHTNVWAFAPETAEPRYYRPLFTVWTILNHRLFGVEPFGWHLSSLLLHLGAVAVLWHLLARLCGSTVAATVGALLFAVHPTRGESVAWVCGLTDPSAALLGFGSVLLLLRSRPSLLGGDEQRPPSVPGQCLAASLFGLALLTKETSLLFVCFPGALAIGGGPQRPTLDRLREAAVATAPWAILALAYLFVRGQVIGALSPTLHALSPSEWASTLCLVIGGYVQHLIAPGTLSLSYPVAVIDSLDPEGWSALPWAMVGLGAWTVAAVRGGAVRPLVWMGGLFLYPVLRLGTLQPDMMFQDRYLYLPSACLLGAAAWGAMEGLRRTGQQLPRGFSVLCMATLLLASQLSLTHNLPAWADNRAVWERAVEVNPQSGRAWMNLGVDIENQAIETDSGPVRDGLLEQAERSYKRAVELEPTRAYFHFRLAFLLAERQALPQAWLHFSTAANLRPKDPMMLYEAGRIEMYRGDLAKAKELLQRAQRSVDEGQLPGGGVTPQDVSALLEEIERSLETRSGISPTLRWE